MNIVFTDEELIRINGEAYVKRSKLTEILDSVRAECLSKGKTHTIEVVEHKSYRIEKGPAYLPNNVSRTTLTLKGTHEEYKPGSIVTIRVVG